MANGQGRVVARRGVLAIACTLVFASCDSSLPQAESAEAMLYVKECGVCHVAYPPRLLRPAMWQMQMERMALLRRQRGLPALSPVEENTILQYLTEHAG